MSVAVLETQSWGQGDGELGAVVRDVAQRAAAAAGRKLRSIKPIQREVRTSEGAYVVRADLLEAADAVPAVVVVLERVGDGLPSTDETKARHGLTAQESRVAQLLAEGRSNRQVAETLQISPHTARHHTESVLSKLGVRSRRSVRDALLGAAA